MNANNAIERFLRTEIDILVLDSFIIKGINMSIPRFSYYLEKDKAYEFFDKNGFCIFNDLVDLKKLTTLREQIGDVVKMQTGKHLEGFAPEDMTFSNGFDRGLIELSKKDDKLRERLYDHIQDLPGLYDISVNPVYQTILKEFGYKIPVIRTSHIRMDIPHDERFLQPAHQEIRSIRCDNMLFFINPLVDTPEEKGAIQGAPGSHKLGPIMPAVKENEPYQVVPDEKFKDYPLAQLPMVAGETLFLNMYLVHKSSKNISDEVRWYCITRTEDMARMPSVDGDDSLVNQYNLKG